jgi:aminotransferase EvaB
MIWRCDLTPQYLEYKQELHEAMERVLLSGRYILANEVTAFEQEFSAYTGASQTVSVANGTDALTLALQVAGVGPGDEVITSPFSAIPTVSAIVDVGATPVFVDVHADTFLMDIDQVPAAITEKTRAIMPVHIFGNAVDVCRLRELISDRVPVIEDACQAHGSAVRGRQCGTMGALGAFSFYPTKNLGAYGDGGAITTNDAKYAEQLRLRRMYGMSDKDHIIRHGINTRLDELQAAVLRVKLKYLERMNERRRQIAARYINELRSERFEHQRVSPDVTPNYHVFVSRVRSNRDELIAHLDRHQIQTNIYYMMPLYRQAAFGPAYDRLSLPNVERICQEVIALPLYPELPDSTQSHIIETINAA